MNKNTVLNFYVVLFIFLLVGCSEEEQSPSNNPSEKCLTELDPVVYESMNAEYNCDLESEENCESYAYLGSASLSENLKANFVDFCNALQSKIYFSDNNDNRIEGIVDDKIYHKVAGEIIRLSSSQCRIACMEIEEALIKLSTERFSLLMRLYNTTDYSETDLEYQFRGTEFEITAKSVPNANGVQGSQRVFRILLEDDNYDPAIPDTLNIRYHESILLNGKLYSNLYSNENAIIGINGLFQKERVYFHPTDGLIGVRDSLGVLWTRSE